MKTINLERIRKNRDQVSDSFANLGIFLFKCLYSKMYGHYRNASELGKKYQDIVVEFLGNPEVAGLLQRELDRRMDSVFSRFKADFPFFSPEERLVFCYTAVGFPNWLIWQLAHLSSENAVCIMKTRMRQEINAHYSPWREEYLLLLSYKRLPIW